MGLESTDAFAVVDTLTNKVIATISIGHAPLAIAYVPKAVTQGAGLANLKPFTLALAANADGSGTLQPLAMFMTNPAGSAIVNTIGPIRQIVQNDVPEQRRYLVVLAGKPEQLGVLLQVQSKD